MNFKELEKRTEVLAKVVVCIADLYHDGNLDAGQKGLLETLIGAGIWYLPSGKELFTGKISKNALEKIITDPKVKLVEEHGFPRKVAGKSLFCDYLEDLKLDYTKLHNLYLNKMGRFNLVLKEENNKLKKFQKTNTFISEEEAYKSAGIELVSIDESHFNLHQLKKFNPNPPAKSTKVKKEKKGITTKTISRSISKQKKTIVDVVQNITFGKTVKLKKGENDSQTYVIFMKYIIDNFSNKLYHVDILSKFIKDNPIDESFGRAVYYKRIVGYNDWYFSTYFDTAAKYSNMKKIADELKFNLELVD